MMNPSLVNAIKFWEFISFYRDEDINKEKVLIAYFLKKELKENSLDNILDSDKENIRVVFAFFTILLKLSGKEFVEKIKEFDSDLKKDVYYNWASVRINYIKNNDDIIKEVIDDLEEFDKKMIGVAYDIEGIRSVSSKIKDLINNELFDIKYKLSSNLSCVNHNKNMIDSIPF